MKLPQKLTAGAMTNAFFELTSERYPTAEKVLGLARQLGIDHSIELQIIVFGVFRDMVRAVAKDIVYRSIQHRDEVFDAIIAALEQLEDRLEQQEERAYREEIEKAKREDNRPVQKAEDIAEVNSEQP